ncbi:hypothetical protein OL548_12790 [Lysinibacillus sp. MHQ-1]|nr:hypothetical protein OL548_12790 [Lysinibacillus sp. MHQ-1]
MFVEGYDEEERLVRYQVARDCILVENGRELVIAPHDRQFNAKNGWPTSDDYFRRSIFLTLF